MCGIAGMLSWSGTEPVGREPLERMRDVLKHRGPDGSGIWAHGCIGLAHTRLAVIDRAGGDQPMGNDRGDLWVVFNGEIYNHETVRRVLEARGHRYRSRSDTETILHAYEEFGDDFVEHLEGMFAIGLWDVRRSRLLLARDRLGIKPLYYTQTGAGLVFASEIKALLASGAIRPAFNEAVLPEYLAMRFVSSDETFFRGVRKLMPGRVLTWERDTGVQMRRYWRLPPPSDGQAVRVPAPSELRAQLESAVARHLMSDVPVGVFLSGGIDSSVLAALFAQSVREPVRTFAVGFAEHEANELGYARLMAQHLGADHHEVTVTAREFFEVLPWAVWHEDEPVAFASSIPLYLLARLARQHVTVVLTGEGADELFLGYNRYRITKWNERLGRPYWAVMPDRFRRSADRLLRRLPPRLARLASRSFVTLEPAMRELYLENFAVLSLRTQEQLLSPRGAEDDRDPYAALLDCFDEASGTVLDRISRVDLETYLLELLMKQDQMSMAASIESRVPYLDDRLVDQVVRLPADVKLAGWQTKVLVRQATQDLLPAAILARHKMGFPVPVGRWLRESFGSVLDEFVLGPRTIERGHFDPAALRGIVAAHRDGRARHGDALWLLVNLEIWQRIFCDGEAPAAVMRCALGHEPRLAQRPVAVPA